jgi:hypothetical protein
MGHPDFRSQDLQGLSYNVQHGRLLRIVTRLPLQELWGDNGFTTTSRGRGLTDDDITTSLRAGLVQFVVVNVGVPPCWIQISDCYEFWKQEARAHLAAPGERAQLDTFPGCYCYFASEWQTGAEPPIVVLEKQH